jgi:hypothetical protein
MSTEIIYSDTVLFRDEDTWIKYPQYRIWHNKLWIADQLGYTCGPCGIFVPEDNYYVVRPVINISGYGVNASVKYITRDEYFTAPPGYFWCEKFNGPHCSFDYIKKEGKWIQVSCWEGTKYNDEELFKFKKWVVADHVLELPPLFDQLDIPNLNVEAIGGKIIEVHLREGNYNEEGWTETIPFWEGTAIDHDTMIANNYIFVEPEVEYSRGIEMLPEKLLGYYVK